MKGTVSAGWRGRSAAIGDVSIDGGVLSAERIRFYRLARPPGDPRDLPR